MTKHYVLYEQDEHDVEAGVTQLLGAYETPDECDREVADRMSCTPETAHRSRDGAGEPPDLLEYQTLSQWNGWSFYAVLTETVY